MWPCIFPFTRSLFRFLLSLRPSFFFFSLSLSPSLPWCPCSSCNLQADTHTSLVLSTLSSTKHFDRWVRKFVRPEVLLLRRAHGNETNAAVLENIIGFTQSEWPLKAGLAMESLTFLSLSFCLPLSLSLSLLSSPLFFFSSPLFSFSLLFARLCFTSSLSLFLSPAQAATFTALCTLDLLSYPSNQFSLG